MERPAMCHDVKNLSTQFALKPRDNRHALLGFGNFLGFPKFFKKFHSFFFVVKEDKEAL